MTNLTFYDTVIALAAMAIPAEQLSAPPSVLNDGYDFFRDLAEFLCA